MTYSLDKPAFWKGFQEELDKIATTRVEKELVSRAVKAYPGFRSFVKAKGLTPAEAVRRLTRGRSPEITGTAAEELKALSEGMPSWGSTLGGHPMFPTNIKDVRQMRFELPGGIPALPAAKMRSSYRPDVFERLQQEERRRARIRGKSGVHGVFARVMRAEK